MPQVPGAPYEPYPTVRPAERVLRPGGVPDVPDAFGAGVARAVSTFGGDVEKAGSQVFNAAIALRKLQIETDVRDAATAHFNDIESQNDKFMTAQGNDAGPAQLSAHLNWIDSRRKAARDDVLQKYGLYGATEFDAQTAAMERGFIQRASQHSFTQVQAARNASIDMRYGALGDQVTANPDDEDGYSSAVAHARSLSAQRKPGLDPDVTKANGDAAVSGLTAARVGGKADTGDFQGAKDMLDTMVKNNLILPDDAIKARDGIDRKEARALSLNKQYETVAREQAQDTVAGIAAKAVSYDDAGNLSVNRGVYKQLRDYAKQNPLAEPYVEERINMLDKQLDRAARGVVITTNKDTLSGLTKNMFNPDRPTKERDIAQAEMDGTLSLKDGTWLRTIVKTRDSGDQTALKDPFFKVAMESARLMIEGSSSSDRQMNAGNYAAFQFQFLQNYLELSREGKLKPGDLNMGDQNSMIRKLVEQYAPGIGQTIRNNGGVGSPPATQPVPAPPPTVPAATEAPSKTIGSKAEYDALPPGATFTYQGKPYTKPREAAPTPVPGATM